MALRFVDSFDHYATAQVVSKYTAVSGSPAISAGAARSGAAGLQLPNWSQYVSLTLDSQPTWIVGFAFQTASLPGSDGALMMFTDAGTQQMDLRLRTDGTLRVTRNGTDPGAGSIGTAVLSANTWYFLEYRVTIADAGGRAVVRVNGTTDIDFTGDTQNTTNASANALRLGGGLNIALTHWYDDLYLCDGTGAAPTNTFLGDCRVECLLPSGNGNSSQFDGSDGNQVDNYALVDETTPDSDTTYVESTDLNDKDTYVYGDLVSTSGTVYAVCPTPYFRKTASGSKTLASVARLSATEVDSAAKMVLDGYRYGQDIREAKPGGGAWSISDVNNAEFGIKVAS